MRSLESTLVGEIGEFGLDIQTRVYFVWTITCVVLAHLHRDRQTTPQSGRSHARSKITSHRTEQNQNRKSMLQDPSVSQQLAARSIVSTMNVAPHRSQRCCTILLASHSISMAGNLLVRKRAEVNCSRPLSAEIPSSRQVAVCSTCISVITFLKNAVKVDAVCNEADAVRCST